MSDRRCPKCGTKLSSYNQGKFCFAHTDGMIVKTKHPVTVCAGRKDRSSETERKHMYLNDALVQEGCSRQDDYFTEEITGVVIGHETVPIEKILPV